MKKKYFLTFAFIVLLCVVAVLATILLLRNPLEATVSKPRIAQEYNIEVTPSVATRYEIKDPRNIGFLELNNGEIVEYCCEYENYVLEVSQMTEYQFKNRSHEKNGLYVHLTGKVVSVEENGVVHLSFRESKRDNNLIWANVTLIAEQEELLLDLGEGNIVEAVAILDDYSFRDTSGWDIFHYYWTFNLSDAIIVKLNYNDTTIPPGFKPKVFGLVDETSDKQNSDVKHDAMYEFVDSPETNPNYYYEIDPNTGYPRSNPPTEG